MTSKTVFVTVGTTQFDELIETILTSDTLGVLKKLGYTNIILQIGNSDNDPGNFVMEGLKIESYKLKESICDDIRKADLIISHAGAGTILEVLDLMKPLLVVINTNLMNNHQIEIAEQLQIEKHLYYCTCDTLNDILENADFSRLRPYPKADTKMFYEYLNNFLGIKSKR